MPRRTITVTHIYLGTRYRPDERWTLDSLPDGADLLYLAHSLFKALPKDYLVDHDRERYVSIEKQEPAGRTLLIELQAGIFGAAGETRNVNTHAVEHQFDVHGAATVALRVLLVVPTASRSALFFVEHGGTGAGGSALLTELKRFLRQRYPNGTYGSEAVVEPEAWLQGADLMRATAVVYGHSPNLEDRIQGLPRVLGRAEHTILPERGSRILPRAVYESLRDRKIKRSELFGISDPEDQIQDVTVKMTNNGREKTFALDNERYPALRYLFTEAGDPEPTAGSFRTFCLDQLTDLFAPVGVTWHHDASNGNWAPEALDIAVEVPPR